MSVSLSTLRRAAVPALTAATLTASLLATGAPALAGDNGSHPARLTPLGTRLLFTANDGATGRELWQTDGTTTARVKDINPGIGGSDPNDLVKAGSLVFFNANDGSEAALWRTNGTSAGTKKLPGSPYVGDAVAVGSRLYYYGSEDATGLELWTSDGSVAGTKRLTDHPVGPFYDTLAPLGAGVVFVMGATDLSADLWRSGPTAGSAKRIKDFGAGSIDWVRNVAGTIYLQVRPTSGVYQLWKSDGTKNGTVKIKTLPDRAEEPTAAGSTLFFRVNTAATGPELWRSKGTAKTTGMVKEIYPGGKGAEPVYLTAVGSRLYFLAYSPETVSTDDWEVWRSDGTKASTVMVKNIKPDGSSEPDQLQSLGGALVFFATDGVHGQEPWRSDGTKAGTVMIKDVNPDAAFSRPPDSGRMFGKLGTRTYFAANDGTHGVELWRTTSGGAVLWANLRPS